MILISDIQLTKNQKMLKHLQSQFILGKAGSCHFRPFCFTCVISRDVAGRNTYKSYHIPSEKYWELDTYIEVHTEAEPRRFIFHLVKKVYLYLNYKHCSFNNLLFNTAWQIMLLLVYAKNSEFRFRMKCEIKTFIV